MLASLILGAVFICFSLYPSRELRVSLANALWEVREWWRGRRAAGP
jgi:hypothetical protein